MAGKHTGHGVEAQLVRGPAEVWAGPPVRRGGLHGSAHTVLPIWAEGDLRR